jgi:hypothetical protein
MEKFKDNEINAMNIIVDSIKDHLIPYISHLDSSKEIYDALTNLFSVRNIGQVMSLKNEHYDMKMNDDDNITSYFVRISQLRDQLQAIEEIISEKELVNIVLHGLLMQEHLPRQASQYRRRRIAGHTPAPIFLNFPLKLMRKHK